MSVSSRRNVAALCERSVFRMPRSPMISSGPTPALAARYHDALVVAALADDFIRANTPFPRLNTTHNAETP